MAAATRLAVTLSRPSRTAMADAASVISARRWAGALRRAAGFGRGLAWGLDVTASMVLGYTPTRLLVYSPIKVTARQKVQRPRAHHGGPRVFRISEEQRGAASDAASASLTRAAHSGSVRGERGPGATRTQTDTPGPRGGGQQDGRGGMRTQAPSYELAGAAAAEAAFLRRYPGF